MKDYGYGKKIIEIENENARLKSAIDYVLSYLTFYAYFDSREIMVQKIISILNFDEDTLNDIERRKLSMNCQ